VPLEELTPQDLDRAMDYFELALKQDPSLRGHVLVWIARNQNRYVPPSEAAPPARRAAALAMAIDDSRGLAHHVLALATGQSPR
jgi:hypothetical protein